MAAEKFPIQRALPKAPTWWRKLPPTYPQHEQFLGVSRNMPTMKFCTGFLDLYRNSWVMPLWSDLILRTMATGEYRFLCAFPFPDGLFSQHNADQFSSVFDNFIHLKMRSPWFLFTKSDIKFLFTGADWSLVPEHSWLRPMTGIVDYKNNHATHVNMFIPKIDAQYELSAGLPLTYIVPLTEKPVELRVQLVTDNEYMEWKKKAGHGRTTFGFNFKCPIESGPLGD